MQKCSPQKRARKEVDDMMKIKDKLVNGGKIAALSVGLAFAMGTAPTTALAEEADAPQDQAEQTQEVAYEAEPVAEEQTETADQGGQELDYDALYAYLDAYYEENYASHDEAEMTAQGEGEAEAQGEGASEGSAEGEGSALIAAKVYYYAPISPLHKPINL